MGINNDINLIKCTADRMRNPDIVKQVVMSEKNKNPSPLLDPTDSWCDLSIAGGYPGILPLFVELDLLFPSEGWNYAVHDYVLKIRDAIQLNGLGSLTIFGGLTGVCYYLRQASIGETKFTKMLNKLDEFLAKGLMSSHVNPMRNYLEKSEPCPPHLYEVIQGLSGVGVYALMNLSNPLFENLAKEIIELLILITNTIEVNGVEVPGWFISSQHFFLEEEKDSYPNGNFNLGLSHGIPGVLAFLSIAFLHQVQLEGQREAIAKVAFWVQEKRRHDQQRFFWDTHISLEEEISKALKSQPKSKDAWCYGTPGVARSLYLAGQALSDDSIKNCALEAYQSIFSSASDEWFLHGPSFCHGYSGLLMITKLMARDSQSKDLQKNLEQIRKIILSKYNPSFPFGFRHMEPSLEHGYVNLDRADILEGASGVLLSLLSFHKPRLTWHLPFLIDT